MAIQMQQGNPAQHPNAAAYLNYMFAGQSRQTIMSRFPQFSSDTGSVGNLMSVPFQIGIGGIKGSFRGLRYGFGGGAYKIPATAQTTQRTITAFGMSRRELGMGIGQSLGIIPNAQGGRSFAPIKATGEALGGTAQLVSQTALSGVRAATAPAIKAAGRGAWSAAKYGVTNAPAAIGSIATGVATAGVTLGAAAYQTSKDLFNFMFTSENIIDATTGAVKTRYELSKPLSRGILPAYMAGHAAYGALKGISEASLGFIQPGELPNMLHNEPNKTRSQRTIRPLKGLDDIAGINFALHKLR